jgi:hypothetical protein
LNSPYIFFGIDQIALQNLLPQNGATQVAQTPQHFLSYMPALQLKAQTILRIAATSINQNAP